LEIINLKGVRSLTLQDLFPDKKLMTVEECIKALNWKTEHPEGDERGTGKITCDCGATVKVGGWVGIEHAWCPNCHKGMQDVTGFLPTKHDGVAFHIDHDRVEIPEDGRVWIPENVWGF